jgi:hypothetical protein
MNLLKKYITAFIKFYNKIKKSTYISQYDLFEQEELKKCFEYFKKYYPSSIFLGTDELREYSINKSLENIKDNADVLFLEFGVYKGKTLNFFAKKIKNKKIFGFDSFLGLKNDWHGHTDPAGRYNVYEKVPKVENNCFIIKGVIEKTLEKFLRENKQKVNFIHMDLDTYESTKYVLDKLKNNLSKNCIILFDQFYNFAGWRSGEFKSFTEVFKEGEYQYLAFSKNSTNVCLKININN